MYKDMSIVGKSVPLRDGYPKVTGAEKFANDRSLAGALWMKILRSPHPHAKIKKIDVTEAEALPGVKATLTHNDVTQKEIHGNIGNFVGRILEDRMRFVGDEVAGVAAESEEAAEQALDLIEWGDIEKGFAEADATIESEVRTQSIYGSFFPPACIADWQGDKLTIMLPHQHPHSVKEVISRTLDIPEINVNLIVPSVQCSMGVFNSCQRYYYIAALLAKKAGRPVIYKMTLEEYGVYKRRESNIMNIKAGGKKDGTITAFNYHHIHDCGAYGGKPNTVIFMHDIFARSNVTSDSFGVKTNKFSSGCIRGVGHVPQATAINQSIDMLSEKLGVDPTIIWKKNHIKTGDPRRTMGPGMTLSSEAFDEMIDKGAIAIEWEKKWQGWGKPYQVIGPQKRGVGMAVGLNASGGPTMGASASVEMNKDGTVRVLSGSIELGTGCKTTQAQICAEVLGFKFEDVHLVEDVNTDTIPPPAPTGASNSIHVQGAALKVAAADAKRQLLEMAHTAPWSPDRLKEGVERPEDLDIKDSIIYVKADPSRRATIKEVFLTGLAPIIRGTARRHDLPYPGPAAYITMACFADVEVDTETGSVNVLKVVQCSDSGRIINPAICENQMHGGTLMSVGFALMEEIVFDPINGKPLNPALSDYWWPTSMDTPSMEAIFSENIDPVGPLGAKGIGEASVSLPHAAIANAIYSAIGVRMSQFPMSPDKVLKALGQIK
jgi:CO/xanthine dehydrogenase Mo-binding subunit